VSELPAGSGDAGTDRTVFSVGSASEANRFGVLRAQTITLGVTVVATTLEPRG
jgi:hypothetical protein